MVSVPEPSLGKDQKSGKNKESTKAKLKTALFVTIISAVTSVTVAYITHWKGPLEVERKKFEQSVFDHVYNEDRKLLRQIAQVQTGTAGPIEQGQKLCRVLQEEQWRDGLIVPKNWPISLCRDYMLKSKGSKFQLGCVYQDGLNLGSEEGTIPMPNCGWQ
jgi:hypothetical protein